MFGSFLVMHIIAVQTWPGWATVARPVIFGVLAIVSAQVAVRFVVRHPHFAVLAEPLRALINRKTAAFVIFWAISEGLYAPDWERHQGVVAPLGGIARAIAAILLVGLLRHLLAVFEQEVIEKELRSVAHARQRNTYSVLVRTLRIISPLSAFTFVGVYWNFNLASWLVTFGGASVAVAFALQRTLSNLFAGYALAADSSFVAGDLIRVGDETRLLEVLRRDARVTVARDVDRHEIVYLPNTLLTESALTEVSRPTDDVRVVIELSVAVGVALREVRDILLGIANGHPAVIGRFETKRDEISKKLARLLTRSAFDDCYQHLFELERLEAEHHLNLVVSSLRRTCTIFAGRVDAMEAGGFDVSERNELVGMATVLRDLSATCDRATSRWILSQRNSAARGRQMKDGSTLWALAAGASGVEPVGDGVGQAERVQRLANRLQDLTDRIGDESPVALLSQAHLLARTLNIAPESRDTNAIFESEDWHRIVAGYEKLGRAFRDALHDCTSRMTGCTSDLIGAVHAVRDTANLWEDSSDYFGDASARLRQAASGLAMAMEDRPSEELRRRNPFRILECRSRVEDEYESSQMIGMALDHPDLIEVAGVLVDDDERSDLGELMRLWGDKLSMLQHRMTGLATAMDRHHSFAMDTELRQLERWLRAEFKEPFPSWKYPVAPIEGYEGGNVSLALKVYIDNAKLDRFTRIPSALGQLKLRIVERLGNVDIRLAPSSMEIMVRTADTRTDDIQGDRAGHGSNAFRA